MKGSIVSVDVSKDESHYQDFKDLNERQTNVRNMKHDKQGFDEFEKQP